MGIERKILDSIGSSEHTVRSHAPNSKDDKSVLGFLALTPELYGQAAFSSTCRSPSPCSPIIHYKTSLFPRDAL